MWEAAGGEFRLGHSEFPGGHPIGGVQQASSAMDLDLRGLVWAGKADLGVGVG